MPPSTDQAKSLGRRFLLVAWLIVFGLLYLFFYSWQEKQLHPNSELSSTIDGDIRQVTLQANRSHAYIAPGLINGHPVRFMIDTGATTVAIPISLAQTLEVPPGPRVQINTAGGTVQGYVTRLQRLNLGPIELDDVRATVTPTMGDDYVLLGMSALRELSFSQKAGELTISQRKR